MCLITAPGAARSDETGLAERGLSSGKNAVPDRCRRRPLMDEFAPGPGLKAMRGGEARARSVRNQRSKEAFFDASPQKIDSRQPNSGLDSIDNRLL